jgi:hypothetical protein
MEWMHGVMGRAAYLIILWAQEDEEAEEEQEPRSKRPNTGGRTRQPFSQLAAATQKNKLTQVRNTLEEVAAGGAGEERHEVGQVLLALSQTPSGQQYFAAAASAASAAGSSSNPNAELVDNNEERMLEKCYAQVGRNAIRFRWLIASLLCQ